MLSVFIDCGPDDQRLAATLAPLVEGAVAGVVRDVVLVDRGMREDARKVADHAGCRVVAPTDLRAAIEQGKGDWCLLLEPGARLSSGWVEAVIDHMQEVSLARGRVPAARFSAAKADRPGFLSALRKSRTVLARGLLLPRQQARGRVRDATTLEGMAKGIAVTTLAATIRMGEPARV